MNKQSHRIVFNETRGSLMAVAETAKANGKPGSGENVGSATRTGMRTGRSFRGLNLAYKLLRRSLIASAFSLGNGLLAAGAQGQTVVTKVIADPTGPASQQPSVLNTSNGVVQVDIRTPSAGGVSRNSYSQFDVGQSGVILNNSRTDVQTQLGGWMKGNPWLATGSARVILNEVNSNNPSYLQGYVEVAGQRASVIIANPSGISINGGGFINASGVTLTTGTPVQNNGNLESFRVQRGSINVEGLGLDNRTADYTVVLSRAAQVNAGLWANRLQVITGANEVDSRTLGGDAEVQIQALKATEAPPAYALDVGRLGGMYAGKIMLIGTEAGLGVRNAGGVQTSSGALTLTQAGWLSNNGILHATGGDIRIQTGGAIDQNGTVYSNQNVQLSSQASQTHGSTTAAQGYVTLKATGANADGTAAQIQASKSAVWAAGLQADGQFTGQQDLTVQADGIIQTSGQAFATGGLSLQGNSLDVSQSLQQGRTLNLQASLGGIQAAGSQLLAVEQLQLNTPQILTTDGAKVQAGTLMINADSLSNVAGQIVQTGTADQNIALQGSLNNRTGLIQSSAHKLTIGAQSIDNTAGQLLHAGSGTLSLISQGQLLNLTQSNTQDAVADGGRIVSVGTLAVQSGTLDNSGEITAGQDLITTTSGLNNTGVLYAAGSQTLTAGGALTVSGTIGAAQDLRINAASVAATGSSVLAAGMAADGKLTGTGALSITTTGALQTAGQTWATGNVDLSSATLDLSRSNTGSAAGHVSLSASSGDVLTKNAQVSSPGILAITANHLASHKLDNTSGQLSSQQLRIHVGQLDNRLGVMSQTGTGIQTAQIKTSGNINNSAGRILANAQDLALEVGGSLINLDGEIGHAGAGTFSLSTGAADNTRGKLQGNSSLVFTATSEVNNTQGLVAAKSLAASADGWNNSQGQIVSTQGDMTLSTQHNTLNNALGLIQSAQDLRLTVQGAGEALLNSQGKILAGRAAILSSGALDNRAGLISAQTSLNIISSGSVNNAALHNQASQIYSGSDLTLHATGLENTASRILAVGNAAINTGSGSLVNTSGLVRVGQSLTVQAAGVDNTATRSFHSDGTPLSVGLEGNNVAISTANLNNTQGAVRAAQDLRVFNDGQLTNDQGELSAGRHINITAAQASAPALHLSNQNGQIVADKSVSVTTGSLIGAGVLVSKGDVSLSLQGDHTLTGTLQAGGNLILSATGQITNPISVQAGKNLTVNAQNLNNQTTGEFLSGQTTHLRVADTLTNRGLIDGADTRIEAATLSNLGTGRLYGDRMAIGATSLLNQEETLSGVTSAATIAGRERVDLGVHTLTNREGALVYSVNDLAIGGALDASWRATGAAQAVNNQSATLESGQSLNIQANVIRNTNEHFASEVRQTSQAEITEYQGAGAAQRYKPGEPDVYTFMNESLHLNTPEGRYEQWTQYSYTRTINENVVTQSAPGKIMAGGGITLTATSLLNDKSQIVAGGTLSVQAATLKNVQGQGNRITTDAGSATSYWRARQKGTDSTGSSTADYTPAPAQETTTLSVTRFDENTANASTSSVATSRTLSTVQAQASTAGGSVAAEAPPDNLRTVSGVQPGSAAANTTPQGTGAQIGSRQTGVRTTSPSRQLPNTSLHTIHPEAQARYLIETDPRFTQQKIWLSSDHMSSQLQFDPTTTQKRLGDGFYEQKLVREQVLALTGQRFLGDFRNDDAQYMALMDAGLTQAKAMNLRPGIALTPAQVAQLTSDMVWLVTQEVTLANGTKQSVLVPQIYVRVQEGDLDGSGALLAGKDINLNLTGDAINSGSIAGRNLVQISANNIRNLGGSMGADILALQASQDIHNTGGTLQAQSVAQLSAGRDLNLTTTIQSSTSKAGASSFAQTGLDRVASLYVTGPAGVLLASAGRDLNLTAAHISNAGTGASVLSAGGNLNLGVVTTANAQNIVWDSKNYQRQSQRQDVGTQVTTGGVLALSAGQDLNAMAATVQAAGALSAQAGNNISISAGQSSQSLDEAHQHTSRGFLSSKTTTTRDQMQSTTALGSSFEGQSVNIAAGQNLSIAGSNVLADQNVNLNAGGSIDVTAAQKTHSQSSFRQTAKSGLMSGGGLSISIGTQQQSLDQQGRSTTAAASTVGSMDGNVNITAGQVYTQTGSNVLTPAGDINIAAKTVTIIEARETGSQTTEQRFRQSGLTVAVTSPVISTLQGVQQQVQAASNTQSSRMQALAVTNAALQVKQGVGQVKRALDQGDATGGAGISVSLGSSSSQTRQESSADTASGSKVTAGGHIVIRAIGAGQASELTVQGGSIQAAGSTTLQAEGELRLLAAQNSTQESSSSKSSSASVGVAFSAAGVGVTASASRATGRGAGNSTTFANTQVSGDKVDIESGADTTLKGATVTGKHVTATVGGNLIIESLQDQSQYKDKSQSAAGTVMLGAGGGASLSLGKTQINSTYSSVGEQSAIRAGDAGFNVSVQGKTELIGGQITSTQAAVDDKRNSFSSTGGTTTTDLHNTASYSAQSVGVSLAAGTPSPGAGLSAGLSGVGLGKDSGSASSTTTAGISGVAGDTQARTGDASSSLKPIFDAEKLKKEIEAQVTITQEFNKQAGKAIEDYASSQRKALQEQAQKASTPEEKAQAQQAIKDVNMQERALNILVSALTGMTGSTVSKEALSTAAEKMRELMIEDSKKFAGVVDSTGRVLSNISGPSEGVRGDGQKVGGTRVDLDLLCGPDNSRCEIPTKPDGSMDTSKQIVFTGGRYLDGTPKQKLQDFLATVDGKKMEGATGGVQGAKGTLFGVPYEKGSWQDKLIEAFAGSHDFIGGKLSSLYDEQGNIKRGMTDAERAAYDKAITIGAMPLAAPFAASEVMSPEIWKAIGIFLGAGR